LKILDNLADQHTTKLEPVLNEFKSDVRMESKAKDVKLTADLLGEFHFTKSIFKFSELRKFTVDRGIAYEISTAYMFKLSKDRNFIFYQKEDETLNVAVFDDTGKLVSLTKDIFASFKIIPKDVFFRYIFDKFFISFESRSLYMYTRSHSKIKFKDQVFNLSDHKYFTITIDEHCRVIDLLPFMPISANSTHVIARYGQIEDDNQNEIFHLLDREFKLVNKLGSLKLNKILENSVIRKMNNKHVFVLGKNGKLRIFDLKCFDLVAEVDVGMCDQMKLISTTHFALLNKKDKIIHIYDQVTFEKVGEKRLAQELLKEELSSPILIAGDSSEFISFIIPNRNLIKIFWLTFG
jgi:hypothetical protein